ncbi:ABC transporter permease [Mycetocola tolaasinivorans]|uniref:ABC transporter permease n=1 Tax=Mycetocola tolaasinivorans TaxID=76635 RepID=A0A3L7ACG7_9MICO|nr:ABC transporter permease [Mycetocola tolaasinivorans]RLP77500.1 ABC transporter permease [Mycetocola tolaasinivorans]
MTSSTLSPLRGTGRQIRLSKIPTILVICTVLLTVLVLAHPGSALTTFRLSTEQDFMQLPAIAFPSRGGALALVVALAALSAVSIRDDHRRGRTGRWVIILFSVLALICALTVLGAGQTIPVPGLLVGALALSVPLTFGALGGVISERAGIINVAIEGQMLAGAFVSAVVASVTRSAVAGLLAALIAGAVVSSVLALFAIRYLVNQVIVGVVLNVLVTGLTSFLFSQILSINPSLNAPERFARIPIPLLSEVPILGPVFFRQTVIVYLMYVSIALVAYVLFFTRWGLRVRAVGEHPLAADTVGIRVNTTRFLAVLIAGGIAGIGGAYFTLGSVGAFNKEMTAGAGFIALAAVIFGRWDPIRATLAALLFGFASSIQNVLGIIGSALPSEFLLALPYAVTILAVAGFVGTVHPPAASGKPYVAS